MLKKYKRSFVLLVATLMMFSFVACGIKMDVNIEIDALGNVTAGVVVAYDENFIDTMLGMNSMSSDNQNDGDSNTNSNAYTDEERWNYIFESLANDVEKDHYEKYDVTDDSGTRWMGIKSKSITAKLEDLTADEKPEKRVCLFGEGDAFMKEKLFYKEGSVYKSNIASVKENDEQFSQIKQNQGYMVLNLLIVVTLPEKAISNNATSVSSDGKTLTWDLMKMQDSNIDFEFTLGSIPVAAVIGIVLGISVLLIVAVIVVIIVVNKKKKAALVSNNVQASIDDSFVSDSDRIASETINSASETGLGITDSAKQTGTVESSSLEEDKTVEFQGSDMSQKE